MINENIGTASLEITLIATERFPTTIMNRNVYEKFYYLPLLLILLLGLAAPPAAAGTAPSINLPYEVEGIEYSRDVPEIEDITGIEIGLRHTPSYQLIEYFQAVAEASPRVTLLEYGRTYEGVPLICAVVTSPENHADLEAIRQNNLKLSDNPGQVTPGMLREMPLVAYIGSGIHGNEASGGEASMLLLYHLAAGEGEAVEKTLSEMVILLDPMINPDGRNRFAQWVNGNRGRIATADLDDREHNEPWPGGRGNHYWFDMNRDLLPAALKETGHRLDLYYSWKPQLVTDHHEQGTRSTFFFQPGIPTGNNPNTPRRTIDLTGKIAEYHARELDRLGSLYFSEEVYDDFYYGKGSTYPDINGGVGILFEQASSRALKTIGTDGEMCYSFTIRNQFATMLSTLEAGIDLRLELLENQRNFYLTVDEFVEKSPVKGYLFSDTDDRMLAESFISLLHKHRIKVYRLVQPVEMSGRVYRPGNSWVVPLNQVQGRLVKTLFEEVTEFRDVVFYDVSAWTMPHAYGLQFDSLSQDQDELIGPEVRPGDLTRQGQLKGGEADYAYIIKWNLWGPAALYQILEKGITARAFSAEIEIGSGVDRVRFIGTSVVVPVQQKAVAAEEVHQAIRETVSSYPVEVIAAGSGISVRGPYLGSNSGNQIRKPKIALITGAGTNSRESGAAWYILDSVMGIPVSLLDRDRLPSVDLDKYNCLVVPSGSYQSWGEAEIKKIREWVSAGGTLIAVRNAVNWAITSELIDEEMVEEEKADIDVPYGEVGKERRSRAISGSIFETALDTSHPLAFGLPESLPVFRNHNQKLKASTAPGANVAVYSKDPLLSGYFPDEEQGRLDGTASIVARKSGSGSVILFLDDPNFRGHWWGTARIFLNAVFFGDSF